MLELEARQTRGRGDINRLAGGLIGASTTSAIHMVGSIFSSHS